VQGDGEELHRSPVAGASGRRGGAGAVRADAPWVSALPVGSPTKRESVGVRQAGAAEAGGG